ncbi:MAG: hypothetical protein LBG05_03860, partial [Treponema sp.]|nr:hypothetical protein [Treponema sp.]
MGAMTAEEAAEWGKTLSFEKVWAALMENREQQKKTDEQLRETQKVVAETQKVVAETSRKVDKVAANVGGLNRSMGELIETLIAARLWEKFTDYPY